MNVDGQILVSLKEYRALKKRLEAVEDSTEKAASATENVLQIAETKQQNDLAESDRVQEKEEEEEEEKESQRRDINARGGFKAESDSTEDEEEERDLIIFHDKTKNAEAISLLNKVLVHPRVELHEGILHIDKSAVAHPVLLIAEAVEGKKDLNARTTKFRTFLKTENMFKRTKKKKSSTKRVKWKDFRLNLA